MDCAFLLAPCMMIRPIEQASNMMHDKHADELAQALKEKLCAESADDRTRAFLHTLFATFSKRDDAQAWSAESRRLRAKALSQIYLNGFTPDQIDAPPTIVWGQTLQPDPAYRIRKLRYRIYSNYWIPALLYEPANLSGPAPVMLNPNGHHWGGKAVHYKQARCINLAKRGVIALNMEFIGMGELQADVNHDNIAHLNLTGLAGVGLFYLAMKKGLDILLDQPHADPKRAGVTGLSGGGWQSIVFAALEERITLAVPVSGYMPLWARAAIIDDIGDLEQAPPDMASIVDYSHLTAMVAPRPMLNVLNEYDEIFRTDRTKTLIYDDIVPTYQAYGAAENFEFYSSRDPGTHCYETDIRAQLYRFIGKHWKIESPARDIHRDEEILGELELNVGLPEEQTTLLAIARERAGSLARRRKAPENQSDRQILRQKISDVIRLPKYECELPPANAGATINHVARVGPLEIPMTIRRQTAEPAVTLLIDEAGRTAHLPKEKPSAAYIQPYPANVIIADILGVGENKPHERLAMLVEAAGQRLLGIQVAQIHALAGAARRTTGARRVSLAAIGQAPSLACLVAAALQPEYFASLTVVYELTTLARLIDWPVRWEISPSMFCFGLLEIVDISDLRMLLDDVKYIQTFRHVR